MTRGIWLLLNSLKLLKLKNINVDIIGIGDQKNKMEKYVKKNNIKNVYFHGYVKDLKPFYSKSDLSIYLTDETGLGISAVDSIFFNIPCLISKNSASIEVFNGLTKYTYQTRNDQDKTGMTKILNNLSKSKKNLLNFKYKSQYFNKFSKKNLIIILKKFYEKKINYLCYAPNPIFVSLFREIYKINKSTTVFFLDTLGLKKQYSPYFKKKFLLEIKEI